MGLLWRDKLEMESRLPCRPKHIINWSLIYELLCHIQIYDGAEPTTTFTKPPISQQLAKDVTVQLTKLTSKTMERYTKSPYKRAHETYSARLFISQTSIFSFGVLIGPSSRTTSRTNHGGPLTIQVHPMQTSDGT